MDSIKLYHHPLSVCSMKVRLALEKNGVDWEGRSVDIVREQEQLEPWYLKLNPGGVLASSHAISDSPVLNTFKPNQISS